jgi:ElaB/YqjD/DUF883 family membrane-anchored ribosome-binding protein
MERCITMLNETADQLVNAGVVDVNMLKVQAAAALEEAARNLRKTDVSEKGEDVKLILHNIENWVNQLKGVVNSDLHKVGSDYHKSAEPVEHIIIDHPIPSILMATGVGVLMGMLLGKIRN